jgi:HEAT repeat protein/thiol-disulfide isomerase/thioredoxin
VAFICNHCPFVKHVRAGFASLAAEYRQREVAVVAIASNDAQAYPDDGPEGMAAEAKAAGYTFPYLFDESQEIAKAYGAACTPDFFLFDRERRLFYRGQMDGSRPGNDVPVTGKDLRGALDAVLEGRPAPEVQRPSLGCNIIVEAGQRAGLLPAVRPAMTVDSLTAALRSLQGDRPEAIAEGLEYLRANIGTMPDAERRRAVEEVCALFYVDTADRPDLQPILDQAVGLLAGQGPQVVAPLLELMKGSDIKSHLYLARTLACVGQAALPALRRVIATDDPYSRSFALFAVGKIHDPAVREALPEVIGSLVHLPTGGRDSAAWTSGKIAEAVPADQLAEDRRTEIFEVLFRTLSDVQPAVRAKAVRSLGKLVRFGYLAAAQEQRVRLAVLRILGRDEAYEWDRAFIVRREAEEALRHLEARA